MFAGLGVAMIFAAVLIVLVKRVKGKPKNKQAKAGIAITIVAVAFVTGTGVAYSFLGRWIAQGIGFVTGLIPGGATATVGIALTIIAIGWAVCDVAFDRKADKGAIIAAILLPTLLVQVAAGQIGQGGTQGVNSVYQQADSLIAKWGGA